jgi:Fe-S-cluster-containing hydrogenase component 2
MSESILTNGYPSLEEIKQGPGYPSEERFSKGPVAVAECIQQIPCNPCEAACKHGALIVGEPITNLPKVDGELCTGCGKCIAHCSGLAIFVINKAYSEHEATVAFPHEYMPLPEKGQTVTAVNRAGQAVCQGVVLRVSNPSSNDCTPVITIKIPKEYADEVRGMKRLKRGASDEG